MYANVNPPPTPEHALKATTEEKEDYENVDDFLGKSSRAPSPPPASEYYNYKPSIVNPEEDYNYIEVTKQLPNALSEEDEYMYMSRTGASSVDQQAVTGIDTPSYQNLPSFAGTDTPKERLDSKGYTELEYERDSIKPSVVQSNTKPKPSPKPSVMAELHFPSTSSQQRNETSLVGKDKRRYINLLPAGEEMYEELT